MNITLDPKELDRAKKLLSGIKGGAQKAVSRALNRTAQSTRAELTRQLTARYTAKSKDLRGTMSLKNANPADLEARIDIKSAKMPVDKFKFKPKRETTGSPHKTVTAEIVKGSPFHTDRGFVWDRFILRRTDRAIAKHQNRPLERMTGPAAAEMAGSEAVMQPVEEHAQKTLQERLRHEITALLDGVTK